MACKIRIRVKKKKYIRGDNTTMKYTSIIIPFVGGLGMFIYGMQIMAQGLENAAGNRMKSLLEALTKNKFFGVLLGAFITAVIQSSSATTVMVVGFVNAGIMNLQQAMGVIMGANIGTTVTGWLVSSVEWAKFLSPSNLAPVAIMIGVIIMLTGKRRSSKEIASIIVGFGLLFIRIYPYLLRIVYYVLRPFWTPSQYMAVTTVCRSQGGKERFLMLFLVMTFSFGLFSANTARAINNNISDRIYYENGADVVMTEYSLSTSEEGGSSTYVETDFSRYEALDGVEIATKVLVNDNVKLRIANKNVADLTLMAIEPDKFAQTAWFRNDLLPIHWWNYCNALVESRSGVIISRGLAEKSNVSQGDIISFKWGGNDSLDTTVMAIVDYWPGLNPNECDFAVMNYNYVRARTELEPYQIWLKMKDGATSEALYKSIEESMLPLESVKDSSQMLISEKTDPSLQGMNGALTLGFIIIMVMTIIGFLIYWILSIKGRTLQFGILRAMGVSFGEIIGILGYEQLLVSGVSIICAFIIGGVTSDLFVPLFQYMYNVNEQIPPYRVAAMQADYIKMYILIAIMLLGGFAILGAIIRKININKALKLGED